MSANLDKLKGVYEAFDPERRRAWRASQVRIRPPRPSMQAEATITRPPSPRRRRDAAPSARSVRRRWAGAR